jgi:DNA-binding IclR family transcriptional regulator
MQKSSTASEPAGSVKSARRAVELLEVLADAPRRLSYSELRHALGMPKSSLHGLLRTLVDAGWVETDERGACYGVGLRALRAGVSYLDRDPVVRAAGLILARLCRELDETVHLARLDGAEIVYLASRESLHHLRVTSRIGRRLPAHAAALGKALLAERTDAEVDALLPAELAALTPGTVTSRPRLFTELADTRVRGWAFEREQNTVGLACFAVAVPRWDGYAISCSLPTARLSPGHQQEIITALAQAAAELGRPASLLREPVEFALRRERSA